MIECRETYGLMMEGLEDTFAKVDTAIKDNLYSGRLSINIDNNLYGITRGNHKFFIHHVNMLGYTIDITNDLGEIQITWFS